MGQSLELTGKASMHLGSNITGTVDQEPAKIAHAVPLGPVCKDFFFLFLAPGLREAVSTLSPEAWCAAHFCLPGEGLTSLPIRTSPGGCPLTQTYQMLATGQANIEQDHRVIFLKNTRS